MNTVSYRYIFVKIRWISVFISVNFSKVKTTKQHFKTSPFKPVNKLDGRPGQDVAVIQTKHTSFAGMSKV